MKKDIEKDMVDPDNLLVDGDEYFKESILAGHLHQTAKDALQKEFDRLCDKYNMEGAYWSFELNLKALHLDSSFSEVLRVVEVNSKDIISKLPETEE